jgi:hypothetical protein
LWFAGASDQPIGNMRWNIIVECVGEDGKPISFKKNWLRMR